MNTQNHFDLADKHGSGIGDCGCLVAVSVEGISVNGSYGNTYGNDWDLKYNINIGSGGTGARVIQALKGGIIARTKIKLRGEQTMPPSLTPTVVPQSCAFYVDSTSAVNPQSKTFNLAPYS